MASIDKFILPEGVQVASHAPLAYTPDFWDAKKAYADYRPDYEGAYLEGVQYRLDNGLETADQLVAGGVSNAIMCTDLQWDFGDYGRLPVIGTNDVVLRTCARMINGTVTPYYTLVVYSQDGHVPHHISYGSRWKTADGKPFDLRVNKAAVLDLADEKRGVFHATCFDPANGSPIDMGYIQSSFNIKDTVAYWQHLQDTGQGPIWVFANHCKLGTDGTNLHPLLVETLAFMEGARMLSPVPLNKGHLRDTDWFGPLEPCRPDPSHPQGTFQRGVVDLFSQVEGWVEFVGVAEDFCDFNMKAQVMRYFAGTQFFEQMAFATDGTAPIVPNAPQVIQQNDEAARLGVHFMLLDDPFQARAA